MCLFGIMEFITLSPILFALFSISTSSDTASFYGASYISAPLQEAKSTTELHFKFRTRRSDAMLFLAAGPTDFCLVRLETGRLKVHINVGAGETEIASPKGLRLDDLMWHQVVITRREAAFTLQVDVIHVVKEKLPGRFFELNINYGLSLGGQGDFSELFLGHLESLRGCLADVRYNGVNVLARARERQGQANVQGITWSCAPEFDAGVDKDMSFVEDGAFVALPNVITRTGARWHLELKTVSERGMLLYNTGLASRSDFVGVELVNGRLRLLLDKGKGATELVSDVMVSDGQWHEVTVQFNPTFIEITVDGAAANMRLPQGGNRYLDLADTAYLGGLDLNKKLRALNQGLRAADASFKGCLRNLEVDGRRVGIPDARVTQGILPDCVWEYPCSREPCIQDAQCFQLGVNSFRCDCLQPLCVKPDYADSYKVFSKPTLPLDLEILTLTPLQVTEGENSLITTDNIDIVLDFLKFGVRDSGVILHMVEPPEHGKLTVTAWDRSAANSRQMFTLLDMSKDKVRYIHDGSENHADDMMFELELSPGSDFVLPSYLQGRHRFSLHVNVTPVNDPPTLIFPPGAVLRLAQGTRKPLTTDLLRAEDEDSPLSSLVYSVLSQGGSDSGQVERILNPGTPVTSFTQQEVERGQIVYAHKSNGGENGRLALQVSDGIETSAPAFLRISAFPLQLRLVNNSGLVLTQKASGLISPASLGFDTNADDPDLDVRYDITKPPQFGSVQRLRGDAQWQTVDHFTSHQLSRDEIRYLHITKEPSHDDFKFKVSVLDVHSPTVYDFRVTFTDLRVVNSHSRELQLNGTREAWLTDQYLQFRTEPLPTESLHIEYRITRVPRYGALHAKHRRLLVGDTFTQQDLDGGRLRYRLHRKAYSHVRDDFSFVVIAPECDAVPGSLTLLHVPSGETKNEVRATLERLQVSEGGRQSVLPTHLHIETRGITELVYNVTHGPHHGRLDVLDVGLLSVLRKNTQYFSSRELMTERVFYVHDDSETRRDSFHFIALSSEEEDFQYVGVFHVDVLLKNDNTPVRAVDKVFRIVSGGERLLTGNDLRYADADVDTRPSDIRYTRRGIPNGGIFKAYEPSVPLFEFSQEDLDNRLVLFRHEGEEYSKVGLWITDGQFYANGVLEVRASLPFVEVANNTGLTVQRGGVCIVSATNLSADTNLNLWGEQIFFEVLEGPNHGILKLVQESEPVRGFTQQDLQEGWLTYNHEGSSTANDRFNFRVDAGGTSVEGKFNMKVFPASYWDPLIVANNHTINVEESTSVVITPATLKVMHPGIPATDITYFVVEPPAYGYLEVEPIEGEEPEEKAVSLFDQALVDTGRLLYVQAGVNRTRDRFVLDVGNGVSWLRGLVVRLVVVPERLYLSGGDLKVSEGETVVVSPGLLTVLTEYYRGRVKEFRVMEPPRAGVLQLAREPGTAIRKFTVTQLEAGIIQYSHDGSESLSDNFVVVGVAGEKESVPATLKVTVVAVNDEPPCIVNNTGLVLWEGAIVPITSTQLAVVDEDTLPEHLGFLVTAPLSGYVAHRPVPSMPIDRFSQAHINNNNIIFVHTGGNVSGFSLTVSDGVQKVGPFKFVVTTRKIELKLAVKAALHVFPLRRQTLSASQLLASCSDTNRPITFMVKNPPTLGQLILESPNPGSPRQVTNFTQRDINDRRIYYQHTHPFFGLSNNDSFLYDVYANLAEPLIDQDFSIDISVSSGGLDQFVDVQPIEVQEGGLVPLQLNVSGVVAFLEDHADLESSSVTIQLANLPRHGEIFLAGDANVTSFTQKQLDAGEIVYQHDGSDTTEDEIYLSLILEPGSVLLCNATLPISIQPVNDQPFKLITPAPRVSVVQGQSCTITRENLLTEDPDTDPQELQYDVISVPSQGQLVFRSNESAPVPATMFSQADVNAGRIVYQHSGPLQLVTFYFRVWDGRFNHVYTVFNIHVLPLTLNVSVGSVIHLPQGSSVASITTEHLRTSTNGQLAEVRYNVTRSPRHGTLYVHDMATHEFGQGDLEDKRVMYMQTDMSTANDSLEVQAWLGSAWVDGLEINVTVVPLIRLGNFTPVAGTKNRLGLDILDATPLAKLTNSNPNYEVVRRPRFGRIKKIIRSSGERRSVREREVREFSHEELRSGVIYYVAKRLPESESKGVEDGFQFLLATSIFQPALGELRFPLRSEHDNPAPVLPHPSHSPSIPGPKDPVSRGSDLMVASPNMSSDYVLIVSMVLGVVVLAVLVIVVVKCRTATVAHQESQTGKSEAPLTLPRPPDELQPTSPRPKRFASSNGSSPIPAGPPLSAANSLLQCKVIPLDPVDSVASSEAELNARYPYGVADEPTEDWSSYDTSELAYPPRTANPMLRRNQYWV